MARASAGLAGLASRVMTTPAGRALLVRRCLHEVGRLAASDPRAGVELARRRGRFLSDRGYHEQARELLSRAARLLQAWPQHAAVLSLEERDLALSDGAEHGWSQDAGRQVGAVLELADAAWSQGSQAGDEETADLLDLVARVVFHRELHFGPGHSPLAGGVQEAERFLEPLRASAAWQALSGETTAQRGGPQRREGAVRAEVTHAVAAAEGEVDAAAAGCGRPHRLLAVSLRNWTFVTDILADLEARPGTEVRRLDLATALSPVPNRPTLIRTALRAARGQALPGPAQELRQCLAWADTILVEWGAAGAAWMSLHAGLAPQARLVVRLHSFEASTLWPHLTRWDGVDTLITVAPPIRRMLEATVPALAPQARRGAGPEILTLPNRAELTRFALPKEEGAERTIAMVGWASRRKDPAWALDLLDLLRQADPAWRLLLIGPDFPPQPASPDEARYAAEVGRRIRQAGQAVRITGRTSEVPRFLRQAGVVVSASRREGTHEGFIEAVASGALPVCRRWPDVAAWGGPAELFPADWVVDTPQEAATRIGEMAADPRRWERECREAAELIIAERDWARVRPRYEQVLLGGRPPA